MHVSELYFYPIKSARGVALDRATLDERGFRNDRRWMVVDEHDAFITQRVAPRMALIDVALDDDALTIRAPGMPDLRVPTMAEGPAGDGPAATDGPAAGDGPAVRCTVWRDTVDARRVSREADDWFSDYMRRPCSLVYMPDTSRRIVDRDFVEQERIVGFADAFPLLVIGQRSLDVLNEKLAERGEPALPMRRFRPNIVVAQSAPHEEDEWRRIRVGAIDVDIVKPCARCAITTVDTETGQPGHEPLRTLSTYRKHGSKVLFGQNGVHHRAGSIAVGDAVQVIARADTG